MSIEIMVLALFAVALLLESLMKIVGNVWVLGLMLSADNELSVDAWPTTGAGIVMMAPPLLAWAISER